MIPSSNNAELSEHDPELPWNNAEEILPTFDNAENSEDGHNRVVASCTRNDENMDTALNYDATNRYFPTQSPEILSHETLPSTIYHPDGDHTRGDIDNSLPSNLDQDDSSNYENDQGNLERAFIREDGLFYRTTKTIKQNSETLLVDDSNGNQSIPGAFQLNRRAPGSRPAWIRHGHAQRSRPSTNPATNEEVRAAANHRVFVLEEIRDESNQLVTLNHTEGNHGISSVMESDSGSRRFYFILAGSSLLLFLCAVGVTVGILVSRQQNVSSPSEFSCSEVPSIVYRSCLCTGAVKDWSIISNNEPQDIAISTHNSIVSETSIKGFLPASYFNTNMDELSCNVTNLSLLWLTEDVIKHKINIKHWYQRFLLAHLYFTWTAKDPFQWKVQTNWLSEVSVCDWYGVTCDKEDKVVQLNLNNNTNAQKPQSEFPRSIFYLTSLLHLDLSGNNLNIGTLPSDIANLTNLQSLNLSANTVTGTLEFDFLSTSLNVLNLSQTTLLSSLPASIKLMTNLTTLDLSISLLKGTIPTEIGALRNLQSLIIGGNGLEGGIPSEIGLLTMLGMNIEFKSELGLLSNLAELYLNGFNTMGEIPSEIGLLQKLTVLDLTNRYGSSEGFSSSIPSEIGKLSLLEALKLSGNVLNGTIPSEMGNLHKLKVCDLGLNKLTGSIPNEFSSCTNLEVLRLRGNPEKLPEMLNQLTGTFPLAFKSMVNIQCFDAFGTSMVGTVPEVFCKSNFSVGNPIFILPCQDDVDLCTCCKCSQESIC